MCVDHLVIKLQAKPRYRIIGEKRFLPGAYIFKPPALYFNLHHFLVNNEHLEEG